VPADYDSADAKTCREVMAKYAPGVVLDNQAAVAASSMRYAHDVLKSVSGDVTKDSVKAAAQGTTARAGFLTHPVNLTAAPKSLPAVGNPFNLIAQWNGTTFTPASVDASGDLSRYVDKQGSLVWVAGYPPTTK
jgi:hypothetical protein